MSKALPKSAAPWRELRLRTPGLGRDAPNAGWGPRMLMLLYILILLAIGGVVFYRKVSREHVSDQAMEAEKVASLSRIKGFNPSLLLPGLHGNYGLAIDPSSKQFAVAIPGHHPRLYHYAQLVAAEIEKDGETIVSTKGNISATRAAVATALFGPVGMVLGAKTSSTSTSETMVTKLALKLYVNDLYPPRFEVPFIYPGTGFAGTDTSRAIASVDDWYGRFRAILMEAEREGASLDRSKMIEHTTPAPLPVERSWIARNFAP